MLLLQFTGLSGSGKTTLAYALQAVLQQQGLAVVVIDGDLYRATLCQDLGFSKADRCENIRRLGQVGAAHAAQGTLALVAAINPYECARESLRGEYGAYTIWIRCPLELLQQRDPKGLYKRALLPAGHPDKLYHFTGLDDPYETPLCPDVIIDTHLETIEQSAKRLLQWVNARL